MKKTIAGVIAATLVTLGASVSAAPVLDFTSDSNLNWTGNNYNLGYSFSVSSEITIGTLGVFDAGSDGLTSSHEVGLWTLGGTHLATATVGPSSTLSDPSASGLGSYVYSDITDVVLGAGTYVIAANYFGSSDLVSYASQGIFSNDAAVTYIDKAWSSAGSSSVSIPVSFSASQQGYFGPSFQIATIPVPAAFPLLFAALGGLAFAARRRRG